MVQNCANYYDGSFHTERLPKGTALAGTFENINPCTGESIGSFPKSTSTEVHHVCDIAKKAIQKRKALSSFKRAEYLLKVAEIIERRKEELAQAISIETGKNYNESVDFIKNAAAPILIGHLELDGYQVMRGIKHVGGMRSDIFDRYEKVFSGHFHCRQDNGNVYYLGNPYQITWSDYKDPRGFHIFDTESRELEFILNPYEMFHKIYYDDEKTTLDSIQNEDYTRYKDCYVKVVVVKKNNPFWFDTLIDKLYKVDVGDISVVENFDEDFLIGDENLIDEAEDTMTILSKYVNSLNYKNKKELDSLMQSLYTESLSVETV